VEYAVYLGGKAMLTIGYATITPESTGSPIVGPSVYKMAADTIEIVDLEHKVTHEYDMQHGTTSGDRHHSAFTIYKAVDCVTPTLYVMCCNAELCTEVKIQYFVQVGNQTDPVEFFSWTLKNAIITEVRQIPARELGGEFAEQYDLLESISFAYQDIEWHHYAHRAPIGLKELPEEIQEDSWSPIA
jgi:type VI secretion system Hcp family effector